MAILSVEEIVTYLKNNKKFLYDKFGVIQIGVFGSFVRNEQTPASDIDMVVEIEKSRKNIHSFLQLKRFLEKDLCREVDLGFEHTLKPILREKIKGKILYA